MKSRILSACALLLAACASAPSETEALVEGSSTSASLQSLPTQTLEPGVCGLFLWTRDEPRRFTLFYPSGSATAEAIVNGRQDTLTKESQGGDVLEQFMTFMRFHAEDGSPVELSLKAGELIEGGRRVPSARMISKNAEGWEIITPLAGLTACQPE
ncbi:MAG: hypothetical protein VR75_06450 [Hyphomonadaceae bacterium BRH_c29]|nr:MAG: hypothetical protein VR75_06450 [Hyphomonadaceae bacterium BRH_c29]